MLDLIEETLPAEPCTLFVGRVDQDRLRVTLTTGEVIIGSYMPLIGQHYISIGNGMSAGSRVAGPFAEGDVASVEIVRTRDEILDERHERSRGAPVPGVLRRDRDGYEARLERIANLIVREDDYRRKRQLRYQFDDVADEVELAQTKRTWLIFEASHRLTSNAPLRKRDLNLGDNYALGKLQRPRPQDFDPDPKVRRARVPVPPHIRDDPFSGPNMLKALRAGGFDAKVSMIGEMLDDAVDLFVVFPGGKEFGRFELIGDRGPDGCMVWRTTYCDNDSKAARRRHWRCQRGPDLARYMKIVATGLVSNGEAVV